MTFYPDVINVVKVQRRIGGFTIPDEFASRVAERDLGIWVEREPLFWQNDKYESKVIFVARYIG